MDPLIKVEEGEEYESDRFINTNTAPASPTMKTEPDDGEDIDFQSADKHLDQGHQHALSTSMIPSPLRLHSPFNLARSSPSEKVKLPSFTSEEKSFLVLWKRRGLNVDTIIPKFEATFKKNIDGPGYKRVTTYLKNHTSEQDRLLGEATQYSWFKPPTEKHAKAATRFDLQAAARTRKQQGINRWATTVTTGVLEDQTLRPQEIPPNMILVTKETSITHSPASSPGDANPASTVCPTNAACSIVAESSSCESHCHEAPRPPSLLREAGNSLASNTAIDDPGNGRNPLVSDTATIHPGNAGISPMTTTANDSPGSVPAVAIWIDSDDDDDDTVISPDDPFTLGNSTPTPSSSTLHISRLPRFAQQNSSTECHRSSRRSHNRSHSFDAVGSRYYDHSIFGPSTLPRTLDSSDELPNQESSMHGVQFSNEHPIPNIAGERDAKSSRQSTTSLYLDDPGLDSLAQYSSSYLKPLSQYEDQLQPPPLNARRAATEAPQLTAQATRSYHQAGAYLNSPNAGIFPMDRLQPDSRGTEHTAVIVKQALAKKQVQLEKQTEHQRKIEYAKEAQREKEARSELQAQRGESLPRHHGHAQGPRPLPTQGNETRGSGQLPGFRQHQRPTASAYAQSPIYLSPSTVQIRQLRSNQGFQPRDPAPLPPARLPPNPQRRGPRAHPRGPAGAQHSPHGQSLYTLDHLRLRPNTPTSTPLPKSPTPDTNAQPHLTVGMFPYQPYMPSTTEVPAQHPAPDSTIPKPALELDAGTYDYVTGMHIQARWSENVQSHRSDSPDAVDRERARDLAERSWFDEGEHHRDWDV